MKKWVLIIISLLALGIVFCCWYFHPSVIFQRKFHFALPMFVRIESYSYDLYYDSLDMKVRFHSNDYPVILAGIEKFGEIRRQQGKGLEERNKESLIFGEWIYELEDFVRGYHAYGQPLHGARSRSIGILITQDKVNPDQYFLYVND